MNVRDQLIQAGVELLEANGLEALTQRQIAAKAGVSHGAPRHHFPSYANLLAAIANVGVDDLDEIIRAGLTDSDARSALLAVGTDVVQFAVNRPAMFELIARHDILDGAGANLREVTGNWLRLLTGRIRDARPDAEQRHALAFWAAVQGLGTMIGRRSVDAISIHPVDPEAVLSALVDGIVHSD